MENSWYSFDVSPAWVLVALLAALGLSVFLYSRKPVPWGKPANIFLGFLRFGAAFLILLLILNPLLQLNVNSVEKPLVIYALDNSSSMELRASAPNTTSIASWVYTSTETLGQEYDIHLEALDGKKEDSVFFDQKTTNLSALLKGIENVYSDKNIGAIVLITDGIINKGQSPAYQNFSFPIYTIGTGDTVPPKDIAIRNVRSNKVAYQGNQFPVQVTIHQKGFDGQPAHVALLESGRTITSQEITFNDGIATVDFLPDASEPGLRRLTVTIEEKEGESSYVNNQQDLYVDVIEGKEKVLILAPAPHPDINAIRTVLNETSNYETVLYIPGIHQPPAEKEFDAIIEHQAFSGLNYGDYKATGRWYILGDRPNLRKMSQDISYLAISPKGNGKDAVRSAYNKSFTKFKLKDELTSRLKDYPPIEVPFGEYSQTGPSEVLLYQQVGSIVTSKPLLIFFDDGAQKSALIPGPGIWQWKLQESGSEENYDLFKEIVLKTVQFLSIKVNKDRFVVKPREANYQIGDRVFIDTEVYNEIYERSYGNTISLTITNEAGQSTSYEMVDSPVNSNFNLGTLEAGIFTFKASTTLAGKVYTESGSFAVRDIQLEGVNLTADHNLLRSIATNSGGAFYSFDKANDLLTELKDKQFQSLIHTSEETFPIINSLWMVLLIVVLLGTEWFLRKYLGAY